MKNEDYMKIAINEANKALTNNEIPVGAVIVLNNKVIAKAYNKKEKTKNPCNHAEVIAIKQACKKIGDWRLNECLLFVTLEPCLMCLGLIMETRIKKIYCSTRNDKYKMEIDKILNTFDIQISYGLYENESTNLLKQFFESKR